MGLLAACAAQPAPVERDPAGVTPKSAAAPGSEHGLSIRAHDGCRITGVTPVARDAEIPVGETPAQVIARFARTYREPWSWRAADRPATEVTLTIAPRDRPALLVREQEVGYADGREEGISCTPLRLFVPVRIELTTADQHLHLGPLDAWLSTEDGATAAVDARDLDHPAYPDATLSLSLLAQGGSIRATLTEARTVPGGGVARRVLPVGGTERAF